MNGKSIITVSECYMFSRISDQDLGLKQEDNLTKYFLLENMFITLMLLIMYVFVAVSTRIRRSFAAGNSLPLSFCHEMTGAGTPGKFIR